MSNAEPGSGLDQGPTPHTVWNRRLQQIAAQLKKNLPEALELETDIVLG